MSLILYEIYRAYRRFWTRVLAFRSSAFMISIVIKFVHSIHWLVVLLSLHYPHIGTIGVKDIKRQEDHGVRSDDMNFLPYCVNIGQSVQSHYGQIRTDLQKQLAFLFLWKSVSSLPEGVRLCSLYYCIRLLCSLLLIAVWKRHIEAWTGGVIRLLSSTLLPLRWPSFVCHSCAEIHISQILI